MFDEVVVVDFSARAQPARGKDSIWVAHRRVERGGAQAMEVVNPPTRAAAAEHLVALLTNAARRDRTVLVGVDFSFGYPAGFADCTRALWDEKAHAAGVAPWQGTFDLLSCLVTDGPDNVNNRFAAADHINRETGTALFWGRPTAARYSQLDALSPTTALPPGLVPNPCAALRRTERLAGPGIRSNFQLYGGITVGGQVLTGIPWLNGIRRRLGRLAVLWPFETGFTPEPLAGAASDDNPSGRRFVLAELWPSMFEKLGPLTGDIAGDVVGPRGATGTTMRAMVRDEAQVRAAADACAAHERAGWAEWFDPLAAASLSDAERAVVLGEEGWILGVVGTAAVGG